MEAKDRIAMSQNERDVLKVMEAVVAGKRTGVEAARLLGRSVRQVRRLRRRLEAEGDAAVVHGLRGKPSNRAKAAKVRKKVLGLYRKRYADFGPTLASEKLAADGCAVCPETLRRWLLSEGLWQRKRRRDEHRRRRPRRECFGELVQMDTSIHEWLEGRGEGMVLTAMIDDATNRVLARFYTGETVVSHFDLLGRWLQARGRPTALYTDRDSIYRSWDKPGVAHEAPTQFGRALAELGIELILAQSPQAKGRVERFFQLAQDRWVKELRLAGVTTRAQANALLEGRLIPEYNRRFNVKPTSVNDAHRRLGPAQNPAAILSVQTKRTVANDYTIRLANRCYQLDEVLPGLRGGKVTVEERLDGTMAVRFREKYVKYREFVQGRHPGALPPDPRSLPHQQPPAGEGSDEKGRASKKARPSAVGQSVGRSGRTPAEPCPSDDATKDTGTDPYRPPSTHPWRRTFLSGGNGGHF